MKKYLFIVLLFIISMIFISCNKEKKDIKEFTIEECLDNVNGEVANVVLLYGQSNAVGYSSNKCLKQKLSEDELYNSTKNSSRICFFNDDGLNSSKERFIDTSIECGANKDYFGPEVGLSNYLDGKIDNLFIIKYAYGGTVLHNQWLDGDQNKGVLYKEGMNFTNSCLEYLVSKGYKISILGICFMQGESDSAFSYTKFYKQDLEKFVSYLREDLKEYSSKISFIDGLITEVWPDYEELNQAKIDFSNESDFNYYIDVIKLGLDVHKEPTEESPDIAHLDSLSMLKLGIEYGKIIEDIFYKKQD